MKKFRFSCLLLLAGWLLAGCSMFGSQSPPALPTVVLGSKDTPTGGTRPAGTGSILQGDVTASGIVAPSQEVVLAFPFAGRVETVSAGVGDPVQAGQVIAHLSGNEQLQAALSAAELNVMSIQQELDKLQKGSVLAAAQALADLVKAQQVYSDTLKTRQNMDFAADSAQIREARATYEQLVGMVGQLRIIYNNTPGDPKINPDKAQALFNLKRAKFRLEMAKNLLDLYGGEPTDEQVRQADANLGLAQAQLVDAQLAYDNLKNGPDAAQMSLLQSRLENAQDQVSSARTNLANLVLKAPFAGVVSQVNVTNGEWISPGQPVLALADLDHLQVKTTDLSERDVPKVKIGQPVTVIVKALNQNVTGRVRAISPLASSLGGDVVYETTIDLDSIPDGLRAGMSVDVQFGTGD